MRIVWSSIGLLLLACSHPSQVSFVNTERPNNVNASQGLPGANAARLSDPNGWSQELPTDEDNIEPEHPLADTRQERALVHIHGPDNMICSGVVIGPRLVATAQRCTKGEKKGVTTVAAPREYRVEVASSSLTWTNRQAKFVVKPACDWNELDIAILVLSEPVPALVVPLKVASAPGTGAKVSALGFGHCPGEPKNQKERVGVVRSIVSESIVIDVPLCKGDTGGPIIDGRDGEVVGLSSHRDDPEGSPLRTSTIARLDTAWARNLFVQAKVLGDGADPSKVQAVACK